MSDKENCELGWIRMCRSCDLDGKSYEHGSEVVNGALAVECENGKWKGRIDPFITVGP
ncbi:MAG: hypothetical protein ACLQBD_24435 [Syntrophobacteraceae bacterium]